MNLSQNKNAVAGHLDSSGLFICVVPSIRVAKLPLHQNAAFCFSGLDRVRRCLEPQILQSQIISLHHRIAIHRKQHDRYGIFGHCDEDVGKNLTWEVLRHVSILGVPPLNHVSRWSSRLQTRPKGQSHLSNSENRMVVICRDWTNVSAEWFWRLAKDTDSILKHWVEQIRWIQRLGARLFNRLFTCKIHSPAALNRSWPGQRWATLVARRAVALAWRHSWEVHHYRKVWQTEIKGFYLKGFLRSKELAGTVGVDPVFPEFGFYLPFSDWCVQFLLCIVTRASNSQTLQRIIGQMSCKTATYCMFWRNFLNTSMSGPSKCQGGLQGVMQLPSLGSSGTVLRE